MKSHLRWFAFIDSHKAVAVIQASTKKLAKERAKYISHLVNIPDTCRIKTVKRGTVQYGDVFRNSFFLHFEEALAQVYPFE